MKKLLTIICIFLIFCLNDVFAHEDMIITLQDGKLVNLPEQYQPASFDKNEFILQLGDKQIVFPECLKSYFPENHLYDLFLTASWYHDLSTLPPYLSFSIRPKGKDYSFNILFDMDTLIPFHIGIELKESEIVISNYQLSIDEYCLREIEKAVSVIPYIKKIELKIHDTKPKRTPL